MASGTDQAPRANREELIGNAEALESLAASHGLHRLELTADDRLIAHLDPAATYFDLVHFEREALALLGHSVEVVSAGANAAVSVGPLRDRLASA